MRVRRLIAIQLLFCIALGVFSCTRSNLKIRMGDPGMASSEIRCDLKQVSELSERDAGANAGNYVLTLWATSPDCVTKTSEKKSEQAKFVVYEEPGGKVLTFYSNKQLGPQEVSVDSPAFYFSSSAKYLEVRIRTECADESDTREFGRVAGIGKCKIGR